MSRYSFVRSLLGVPRYDATTSPMTIEKRAEIEIGAIAEAMAVKWRVSLNRVMGGDRRREAAWARQDAMRAAYDLGRYSLTQIGRVFDRDHTSVKHGIARSRERAQ